jgi:plastocyanin
VLSDRETPPATGAAVGGPAGQELSGASTGGIRGIVHFEGTPPKATPLEIPSNCAPDQKGTAYAGDVLVAGGRVQNAFVWVSQGLETWHGEPATAEVVVDQRGCVYHPRVLGVRVGQPVVFVNSDGVFHNVHAAGQKNAEFNLGMPSKDMRLSQTFTKPEVMVHSRCDVHPWMSAYIGVLEHPYFAVSGPQGQFELRGLPPGDYQLESWHEVFGRRSQKISVKAGGVSDAGFSYRSR